MLRGTVRWFDPHADEGRISHAGHDVPIRGRDLEPAARVRNTGRVTVNIVNKHGVRS